MASSKGFIYIWFDEALRACHPCTNADDCTFLVWFHSGYVSTNHMNNLLPQYDNRSFIYILT